MKAVIKTKSINVPDETARIVLRMAQKFYSDPKNMEAFERWNKEQKRGSKNNKLK